MVSDPLTNSLLPSRAKPRRARFADADHLHQLRDILRGHRVLTGPDRAVGPLRPLPARVVCGQYRRPGRHRRGPSRRHGRLIRGAARGGRSCPAGAPAPGQRRSAAGPRAVGGGTGSGNSPGRLARPRPAAVRGRAPRRDRRASARTRGSGRERPAGTAAARRHRDGRGPPGPTAGGTAALAAARLVDRHSGADRCQPRAGWLARRHRALVAADRVALCGDRAAGQSARARLHEHHDRKRTPRQRPGAGRRRHDRQRFQARRRSAAAAICDPQPERSGNL